MFLLFSNRLGCMTSIIVSIAGTVVIIFLMKGCQTAATASAGTPLPVMISNPYPETNMRQVVESFENSRNP